MQIGTNLPWAPWISKPSFAKTQKSFNRKDRVCTFADFLVIWGGRYFLGCKYQNLQIILKRGLVTVGKSLAWANLTLLSLHKVQSNPNKVRLHLRVWGVVLSFHQSIVSPFKIAPPFHDSTCSKSFSCRTQGCLQTLMWLWGRGEYNDKHLCRNAHLFRTEFFLASSSNPHLLYSRIPQNTLHKLFISLFRFPFNHLPQNGIAQVGISMSLSLKTTKGRNFLFLINVSRFSF